MNKRYVLLETRIKTNHDAITVNRLCRWRWVCLLNGRGKLRGRCPSAHPPRCCCCCRAHRAETPAAAAGAEDPCPTWSSRRVFSGASWLQPRCPRAWAKCTRPCWTWGRRSRWSAGWSITWGPTSTASWRGWMTSDGGSRDTQESSHSKEFCWDLARLKLDSSLF